MNNSFSTYSRRAVLRGLGVSLALPLLPSLSWRAFGQSKRAPAQPQRFVFMYTPNGYNQQTFIPKQTGAHWDLPPALTPLAPIQSDVTLVTGLDRRFVPGTGVHAQCGSCWLTSSPPQQTLDGGFPTNLSLDQIIARRIGQTTPLPSLELSTNDFSDNKETKYFESISWYGPGYAANTEKNPRRVFQRLFGQASGGATRSVLDVVRAEANALRAQLARDDQTKLDEYLTSVRATEHRIQLAEKSAARARKLSLTEPAGIPERRDEYLRLMCDLIVHAFELDLTRVATLVVDPERWDSPRMFHGLFDKPQNHHVLTHTKTDEAMEKITRIDRFHVAQFAYLVGRLQQTGKLLAHTTVVMGSGISDGDLHDYTNLQVLLAGGRMPRGHFHFDGARPLADLWLTLAQSAGVPLDRFADSTGVVKELVA
jgi:hypothetical protein